ncbi:MAG: AraC family transcriptional regulator [Anaerolineales bacterium]|nr:AraC family transcriptional regulator [Anaerolineales bacterium]
MMNLANTPQIEREAQREQANRAELAERIEQVVRKDGKVEPLKGLYLHRLSFQRRLHSIANPGFCVIAQGSKEVFVENERFQYDPWHYLLITADLPTVSHVLEASPERPYLSLRVELDPVQVGSVMTELGHAAKSKGANAKAINVSTLDADLLDTIVRLVRLIDTPTEARVLAPLLRREIVCRLLLGQQGGRLRHLAVFGGFTSPISRAIERFRKDFDQQLRMEDVAQEIGMSVSSLHHQFKAVTALTPLQFQKRLRLQEARRLMLGEDLDATSTAFRVGYNDASHFNREYKRLFGLPPVQDVERLREVAGLTI